MSNFQLMLYIKNLCDTNELFIEEFEELDDSLLSVKDLKVILFIKRFNEINERLIESLSERSLHNDHKAQIE